jgi:hypothetical protein
VKNVINLMRRSIVRIIELTRTTENDRKDVANHVGARWEVVVGEEWDCLMANCARYLKFNENTISLLKPFRTSKIDL